MYITVPALLYPGGPSIQTDRERAGATVNRRRKTQGIGYPCSVFSSWASEMEKAFMPQILAEKAGRNYITNSEVSGLQVP